MSMPRAGFECFFQWCAECLQGVDYAYMTDTGGVFDFTPCGHRARFYEPPIRNA